MSCNQKPPLWAYLTLILSFTFLSLYAESTEPFPEKELQAIQETAKKASLDQPSFLSKSQLKAEVLQYKTYFANNNPKTIQSFIKQPDGSIIQHGLEITFYPDSKVASHGWIAGGKRHGRWVFINKANYVTQGEYQTGQKSGIWRSWAPNHQLTTEESYWQGKLHGPKTTYHLNGKSASQEFYNQGLKQGTFSFWHANGVRAAEQNWLRGVEHGPSKQWSSRSVLTVSGQFHLGSPDGEWVWKDVDGKVLKKSSFVNGTGTFFVFAPNPNAKTKHSEEHLFFLKEELPLKSGLVTGKKHIYFANGTLRAAMPMEAGFANGPVTEWYSDGSIRAEGNYVKDKLQGTYLVYHSKNDAQKSSVISEKHIYHDDEETATVSYYSIEGIKTVTMETRNGKPHGKFEAFYPDGGTMQVGHYYSGNKEGEWKEWYPSGALKASQEFYANLPDGSFIEFFDQSEKESQNKHIEGEYRKGHKHGHWRTWFVDGAIQTDAHFTFGLENGAYEEFWNQSDNKNQKKHPIKTRGFFVMGLKDGEWTTWHSNSHVASRTTFDRGEQHGNVEEWFNYQINGKQVPKYTGSFSRGKKDAEWRFYYPNGALQIIQPFVKGKLNGTVVHYFDNDVTQMKSHYQQGLEHGIRQTFHKNKNLASQTYYEYGKAHGNHSEYHSNGKLAIKGQYSQGLPQDEWKWFAGNGKDLIQRSQFEKGNGILYTFNQKTEKTSETPLANGLKHGKQTEWYPSGSLKAEVEYMFGQLHGTQKQFYENEQLLSESFWIYGRKNGNFSSWYENSQERFTAYYNNDLLNGLSREWHENGRLKAEGRWLLGLKDGEWNWFDQYGEKLQEQHFDVGILLNPTNNQVGQQHTTMNSSTE